MVKKDYSWTFLNHLIYFTHKLLWPRRWNLVIYTKALILSNPHSDSIHISKSNSEFVRLNFLWCQGACNKSQNAKRCVEALIKENHYNFGSSTASNIIWKISSKYQKLNMENLYKETSTNIQACPPLPNCIGVSLSLSN